MGMIATDIEILITQVEKEGGSTEWTIVPQDETANDARFHQHQADIERKYVSRRLKKEPDHHPIVFAEGDTLTFRCAGGHPFGIGAKKNPDLDEFPGAPDTPFAESGFRSSAGAPVSLTVSNTTERPGPKHQGFYKFHGWVRIGDEFIAVDPDGYCGG